MSENDNTIATRANTVFFIFSDSERVLVRIEEVRLVHTHACFMESVAASTRWSTIGLRRDLTSVNYKIHSKILCDDRTSSISEKRWHDLRSRLSVMLDHLDRREKLIIRARFSLGFHRKVHTLQSLANRLGISKERVRQLEMRAMEKLQSMVGNAELFEHDPSQTPISQTPIS